jgi:hypothetical protein
MRTRWRARIKGWSRPKWPAARCADGRGGSLETDRFAQDTIENRPREPSGDPPIDPASRLMSSTHGQKVISIQDMTGAYIVPRSVRDQPTSKSSMGSRTTKALRSPPRRMSPRLASPAPFAYRAAHPPCAWRLRLECERNHIVHHSDQLIIDLKSARSLATQR